MSPEENMIWLLLLLHGESMKVTHASLKKNEEVTFYFQLATKVFCHKNVTSMCTIFPIPNRRRPSQRSRYTVPQWAKCPLFDS